MARVAQAGHTDVQASYNRVLNKTLTAFNLECPKLPENFELGDEQASEIKTVTVLESLPSVSSASACLGPKCAVWRGYCGLAGRPEAS